MLIAVGVCCKARNQRERTSRVAIAVCNFRVAAACSYLVLALITTSNDLVQTHLQSLTTDQMCPSAVTTALKLPELRGLLSLYVCEIYRQLCRARPHSDLIFREGEFWCCV